VAERKAWWEILRDQFASRGLLDPESERVQEAVQAAPAVQRQARGLLSLDPQAESDTVLEMGLGSLPGTGQLMALRDLERARRAKDPGAAAMAASNFIPFGTLLNRFRRGPMSELDVYHGTPHQFPGTEANPLGEFDASKIGTGEGQQVYGHGIYLAEAQDVGDSYRRALTPHQVTSDAAQSLANYAVRQRREPEAAIQWLEKERKAYKETPPPETMKQYDDAIAILRKGNVEKVGNLYKADLPDEMIDRMLDWDAPVDEDFASKFMRAVRRNKTLKEADFMDALGLSEGYLGQPEDGRAIYKLLSGSFDSDAKASKFLRNAGIPGIRFKDANSRGGDSATGTRNFVVFPGEEKKVKILERK